MRNRLLAGFAALVALGTGCSVVAYASGNPVNSGPLGGTNLTVGTECFPIHHRGAVITDGFNEVQNSGSAVAVIDKVTLLDPHGLRVLTAWAVPVRNLLYGVEGGYPLASKIPGLQWPDRHLAAGASMPHTGSNAGTNLLVVIQTSGRRATDHGLNVYYHVGDQSYHMLTGVDLVIVLAKACTA